MAYSRRNTRSRRRNSPAGRTSGALRSDAVAFGVVAVALVCYFVVSAGGCNRATETPAAAASSPSADALMEVKAPRQLPQKQLKYMAMDISFNPITHQPNWVAWELLGSEVSDVVERDDNFLPDPAVKGCATPDDYRYTGYDRGHMAPAGDMKWHPQAMRESFYMTNICPQAPDLNRGAWQRLEKKCRERAVTDSALIIICGPIFDTPATSNGTAAGLASSGNRGASSHGKNSTPVGVASLGETGVAVPQRFFKVILAPYVSKPWAIGFIMPNGYVEGGIQKAAVPVDSVERATGYDFFSALPDPLETRLEQSCNFNAFSHTRRP